MKYINQLESINNSGFFGKGPQKIDIESEIRDSLLTSDKRTCGPKFRCIYTVILLLLQ